MWLPLGWIGPFHIQTTNGLKKSKCLNFIHEVREKERYTYLDFGKTVSRYFEKAATAMVKAPRCSLRVAASVADQGVN